MKSGSSNVSSSDWIIEQTVKCGKNIRGNSRNSGHQVQTYKMSEGTSSSAYMLHPFQTLVPRFWNGKDGGLEIGGSERGSDWFSE